MWTNRISNDSKKYLKKKSIPLKHQDIADYVQVCIILFVIIILNMINDNYRTWKMFLQC